MVALVTVSTVGMHLVAAQWANGSCVVPVLAEQILRADAVASGLVTAVGFGENRLTFRSSVLYKGTVEAGPVTVQTGPSLPSGAIGFITSVSSSSDYRADPGSVHTLYLRRDGDGFVTDSCAGSHPGSATNEEIAALGSGRAIDSGAGPLTQLLDQVVAVPMLIYCLLLATLVVVLWRRSRRGSSGNETGRSIHARASD